MMSRPRFFVCLGKALLLTAILSLQGCGDVADKKLGEGIDSPITMVGHPSRPVAYVLNAVLGAGYKLGSLQSYQLGANQLPNLVETLEAPRLGTALAIEKTGDFLVAGFSGTQASLRIFNLNADAVPSVSERASDVVLLNERRIQSIRVNPLAGGNSWSIVVSSNAKTSTVASSPKIDVFRYTKDKGFEKLITAPDDFYTPSRENPLGAYSLGWTAPVVFESLGLVVAFPVSTSGYQGLLPTAHQWLRGENLGSEGADLRIVSALLIDLNKLSSGGAIRSSIGFAPLAFTNAGTAGNPEIAADNAVNADLKFRVNYASALALDSAAAPCVLNSPLAEVKPNAAIVAYGGKSSVIVLGGFDQAASQLRQKLTANELEPILGPAVTASPVSIEADSEPEGVIRGFHYMRSGSRCSLGWMRTQQGVYSLGAEKSQIRVITSANASEFVARQSSLLGTTALAVVDGSVLLTGSFGQNKIQQYEFNGSEILEGGVYP